MTTAEDQMQDAFEHSIHDLPNEKQRAAMSILELAELLAGVKADSVAYIVISHELNLKIAEHQAKLNHRIAKTAGAFTLIGAIVGAGATAFFSSQAPQEVVHCYPPKNSATAGAATPSVVIDNRTLACPPAAVGVEAPAPPKNK